MSTEKNRPTKLFSQAVTHCLQAGNVYRNTNTHTKKNFSVLKCTGEVNFIF